MVHTITNITQSASGGRLNLKSAQLRDAVHRFADLASADLEGAELTGADLQHACFNKANLRAANLSLAKLGHADLGNANLKEARLCGASLHLASLEAANLEDADLTGADLLHGHLKEANLRGANLSSARLDHVDFASADLTGANLRGASLHHAKNLTRAQLKLARLSKSTILPPHLQRPDGRSATRKMVSPRPSISPLQKARARSVPRLTIERPALVGMAFFATLFVVGVASEQITRNIRFSQLEINLGPAHELYALPATLTKAQPTFAWPVFAILPETQLHESTVALKDASQPDILRPVTTIRMMRAQEIARLPFDTSRKQPIDALVAGQVTVMASYYGKEFAGRRTASGEKFNPGGMTAAHRTLPFGTRVRVTHSRNGRSVTVRINDRGPFIKGRSIDLSAAAATAIGMGGSARVQLNIIR
jgi:uncharacterized protein YjbI with pentapeptide repeats